MEVIRDSLEAGLLDVKSTRSRFLSTVIFGVAVTGLSLALVTTESRAQQEEAESPESAALDSLPALERARQFLIARQFEAALAAAEEAAEERGIAPASRTTALYTAPSGDTASVHLYRGLALELRRRFPEAVADYEAFLSIEPDSWRTEELMKRYPYVSGQALRFDARMLRDNGVVPDSTEARFGVGVFPLYNASSILVMSQVSFGLTGLLHNALGILDHFTDTGLPSMPYSQVRLLLDEILPEEVHVEAAAVEIGDLTRVLGVEYLGSGILDEVSGSLTGEFVIGAYSDTSEIRIEDVQASYTSVGLLDLQRNLVLSIADSIRSKAGFSYVPSRQAFADSVEQLLIDDVGVLLTYGFAVEQLLLGEPVEAQALMMDLPQLVAGRDLEQIAEISVRSTPPADNLMQLTALSPVAVRDTTVTPDTTAVDTVISEPVVPPSETVARRPSESVVLTAQVISAAAARHLGDFSLWGPTGHEFVSDEISRDDPRRGVAGALDPTRSVAGEPGVPIDVVIPLPPAPRHVPANNR